MHSSKNCGVHFGHWPWLLNEWPAKSIRPQFFQRRITLSMINYYSVDNDRSFDSIYPLYKWFILWLALSILRRTGAT